MVAGPGDDRLLLGIGADYVDYSNTPNRVHVDLPRGSRRAMGNDTFDLVENVVGSPLDDTLLGAGDNNQFFGRGGNDFTQGGGGNDSLEGGSGRDTVFGDPAPT